ncbi:Cell division topological specificity factor [Candidatus Hydrogenisulfobacillus filiaventi]|uniref:Cell division topological specificity factor n=1 Tax=Candidatus Hydrogenisulfobacillus filiaventi TaxID=2707344 RepID=A0A6F8ZI58_9FIRM|nr:cell division topological specificity factor MinE [Bacillota bacterium]CAB1129677.1 Cell division topological specificity factor [Candidatus Hydrogenisulfobacillus filiaventi]
MDLWSRLFTREDSSKEVAKERLRLVLIQDRASLSARTLEALKGDLLKVISEYLEIDDRGFQVDVARDHNALALVANIPILRVKRTL